MLDLRLDQAHLLNKLRSERRVQNVIFLGGLDQWVTQVAELVHKHVMLQRFRSFYRLILRFYHNLALTADRVAGGTSARWSRLTHRAGWQYCQAFVDGVGLLSDGQLDGPWRRLLAQVRVCLLEVGAALFSDCVRDTHAKCGL